MLATNIRHILVIRLGSLSSVAMCVHALRGLVRDFSQVKITVLTLAQYKPLFRGVKGLEFLFADEAQYRGCGGTFRLWCAIQRLGVDAIADLTNSPFSRALSFSFTPWRRRVVRLQGQRLEGRALTRKYRKVMVQLPTLASRSREVFGSLGLPFCMPAPVRQAKGVQLPNIVDILAGEKSANWVGIAPLSNHNGTCYPLPKAAELVGLLAGRYQRVFLFGEGLYQRQFCEGMQSLYGNVISVAGRLSLAEQMDVLSVLDAVVSVDSDVLRLASLVGTPVISIWGATHPYLESSGYGQDPRNALQKELPCRPCSTDGRHRCLMGDYQCMNSISPEEIFRRVKSVTGRN